MKKLVLLLAVLMGVSMLSCGGSGENAAEADVDSALIDFPPVDSADFIDSASSAASAILNNAAAATGSNDDLGEE